MADGSFIALLKTNGGTGPGTLRQCGRSSGAPLEWHHLMLQSPSSTTILRPAYCFLGFHNFDIDTYFTHYLEKVHFDGLLRIFADKTIGDNFVDKHPNFNVETINCLIIHREATLLGTFSKYSYDHHITFFDVKIGEPYWSQMRMVTWWRRDTMWRRSTQFISRNWESLSSLAARSSRLYLL